MVDKRKATCAFIAQVASGGAGGIRNHVQLGHCSNSIPVSPKVIVSKTTKVWFEVITVIRLF
jgi:hypothetical protein